MGEVQRVAARQLLVGETDDVGEVLVGLDHPTTVGIAQGNAQRRLLEDDTKARLGRPLSLQCGQFPALTVPAPELEAGGVDQQEAEPHEQGRGPGHAADTGIGLELVDLGDHQPGRAGDGGGVGQHGDTAIIAAPGEDAAFGPGRPGRGQVGRRQGAGQRQRGIGPVAQRRQKADPIAVAPDQIGLRRPCGHRPGLDQGV